MSRLLPAWLGWVMRDLKKNVNINLRMNKLKKIAIFFISTLIHLVAGGAIYYFWQPIVAWYWNYRPILGVDFYNHASYVSYLTRHFALRFNGWKYIWHGGYPLDLDYPTLHAYLNLPLLSYFNLPQAVQAYMLGACFLFLFFSYLLFSEIGKDRVLAAILTIASSFSIAIYGALVWGGSLPYFATQFFLPLTLWLLVKFFNTTDKRWFFLSSLFFGLSFFGHFQVAFSYTGPSTFLLLLFYPFEGEKFFSWVRWKRVLVYFFIVLMVGFPQLVLFFGYSPQAILVKIPQIILTFFEKFTAQRGEALPGVGPSTPPETLAAIAEFQRQRMWGFLKEVNTLFFTFLKFSIFLLPLSLMIRKKKKRTLRAFVFALPALWVLLYNFLYVQGIGLYHGGWYRAFWPLPLFLGMLVSFIWDDFWASVRERFPIFEKKLVLKLVLVVLSGIIVLAPSFFFLKEHSSQKMLEAIEIPLLRQQSSAYPDSLNVYIENEEFKELKSRLTPSWLNPNETNYRLYENDQRVNIWWNSLFDMPLVKGYIDHPSGDPSGGFYWMSIALSQFEGRDVLVENWEVPAEMAYNNALFLIDWYSAKYLEAEHEKSDTYNPPASYLVKSDIFARKEKVVVPGWIDLYNRGLDQSGSIVWKPEVEEYLTYYEVKDDFVSPIAHPTSASTIGVIGALDAYRTILRNLAAVNLNSRRVIPLQLGQIIDNVSQESLKNMDMIILYAYDYQDHGKAWAKLEKYVKEGGKVLIETGSDVKQTDSINLPGKYPKVLPEIFPLEMTKQEEIGKDWQLSSEAEVTKEIDFEAFGPPILDGEPWLFSLPNSSEDLREGAKVILANKGTPLVVGWQYGQGEVVWSGMNLPYHVTTHKNLEEANFFKDLIEDFMATKPVDYADFKVDRQSGSEIKITGRDAGGVFFREQHFPGWEAKVNGKKAPIYRAGPTYPGFMYVIIPQEMRDGEFEVSFSFRGESWSYVWQIVSWLTILILLDKIIFNARVLTPILNKISRPLVKRMKGWWEKEEY